MDHYGDFEFRDRSRGYDDGGDPATVTEEFHQWVNPICNDIREKARECDVHIRIITSSEYGSITVEIIN